MAKAHAVEVYETFQVSNRHRSRIVAQSVSNTPETLAPVEVVCSCGRSGNNGCKPHDVSNKTLRCVQVIKSGSGLEDCCISSFLQNVGANEIKEQLSLQNPLEGTRATWATNQHAPFARAEALFPVLVQYLHARWE